MGFFKKNSRLNNFISESKQILQSNDRGLIFNNVMNYADYFSKNKNEFIELNSDQLDKLEVIVNISVKATQFIPNLKFPFSTESKKILVFTLLVINKMCQLSKNEKYVKDKMIFFNKQPSFMISLLLGEAENKINKLQIFRLDEDYAIKILQLLSAEIILTSFLKDVELLLYNHSLQQLKSGYFNPIIDMIGLKSSIKKAEAAINETLLSVL